MKHRFLFVLVAFGLVACAPNPPDPAKVNLAYLAEAGGYRINGTTMYEKDRWTLYVRVEGCANSVKLGGEKAPETMPPTQYEILEIGGKLLKDIDPTMSPKNRPAPEIRMIPGIAVELGC